ncbi:hypothetical protein NO995_01545 [Aestuariibaculum sp. M13]|uniref:hypothetical protein n=1 Tax=Aestuariibaculum sp. M13 TaxID=2967132 RepID=UPI00215A03A5|nr:hypothetical protein [Aestuariibaculum sp. M13]MCR8666354.1 hypothetical protein [Aestuariibaculum sp. M13]
MRQASFYKPSFVVSEVNFNDYDYIVLGSSIGLTTLNTEIIDSITGFQGLNLSMDDTGIGEQCLMFEHFLAERKTTKVCVLATSAVSLNSKHPGLSTNSYRFLPFIKRDYVNDFFTKNQSYESTLLELSKYAAVFGVSYYNVEIFYPSILSAFEPHRHNRFDDKGNYHYPVDLNKSHKKLNFTNWPIRLQNPYLKRLKSLCKKHKVKLMVYIAPIEDQQPTTLDSDYQITNHSTLLNDSYFFYDRIHVNLEGSKRASYAFSPILDKFIKMKNE